MKKILRIMVIALLFGIGFLYIIKNPSSNISRKIIRTLSIEKLIHPQPTKAQLSGCANYFDGCNTCKVLSGKLESCTEKYCTNYGLPKCMEYIYTGIDLTNCVNYYDGCNTCKVLSGRLASCTLKYCVTRGQASCREYTIGTKLSTIEVTGDMALPSSASLYCTKKGGTSTLISGTDNRPVGMCTLSGGVICEEQAYMNGKCPTVQTGTVAKKTSSNQSGTKIGSGLVCTKKSPPVCAKMIPSTCDKPDTPECYPDKQKTFTNRCLLNANKLATFFHDGKCR